MSRITPSTALGAADALAAGGCRRFRRRKPRGPRARPGWFIGCSSRFPSIAPETRAEICRRYLDAVAPGWLPAERSELIGKVLAILADPVFAPVFAAGSRAEVDVAGMIDLADRKASLSGRIDRLAVTADRVLIVDYKTNRPPPERLADAPAEYVAQLAVYRAVLQRLYPNRPVAAAILWTDRPSLMEIPSSTLDEAMRKIALGHAESAGQTSGWRRRSP